MDRLIPFSPDVYVGLFARYNEAIWPMQLVALGLGAAMLICLKRGGNGAGRTFALIVSAFWAWTGWAFHLQTYATLNWAAWPFGALFILQGLATLVWGSLLGRFELEAGRTRSVEIGIVLLGLAVVVHPILTVLTGLPVETAHLFGVTPMPTALIGVAALYLVYGRPSLWLLAWPMLWSAWEMAQASAMGVTRDMALPALTLFFSVYLAASRIRR